MRNLTKRLAALEGKIQKPATPPSEEWYSLDELTKLAYFLLVHNILRFDDNCRVLGGSAFGEDYGWLADAINKEIAANPDVLPIFPIMTDEAKQALAALDAGHITVSGGRVDKPWHGPSVGDLPYIVERSVIVLNAQLTEPVALTVENVKELLQIRAMQ